MEVVINKRKIRDTVGQIVADGNKAVRDEARDRISKRVAVTHRIRSNGFGFASVGNAVPLACR